MTPPIERLEDTLPVTRLATHTISATIRSMAATTTLRVRPDTRDRLNRLAREHQLSAPELIERLVEREEEHRQLSAMNADFEQLRGDERAWAQFKVETAEWDTTSSDPAAGD